MNTDPGNPDLTSDEILRYNANTVRKQMKENKQEERVQ